MAFTKFHLDFFQRAVILQGEIIRKKNTHLLFFMKFQEYISFRNIIVAKFQGPKFRKRAITQKISYNFFFNFSSNILFIIPYQLSRFNTFRDTAFTKFHTFVFQRVKGP